MFENAEKSWLDTRAFDPGNNLNDAHTLRAVVALEAIAAALCRIDHRLDILTKQPMAVGR